jgi:hypothetical protein
VITTAGDLFVCLAALARFGRALGVITGERIRTDVPGSVAAS